MDPHVVIRICLRYDSTIGAWSRTRVLNRNFRHLVDTLPDYDKECIGRATYIPINGYCEVCGRTTSNFSILNYWSPSFGSVLHLPHCNTWQCKLSAIFSMVQYYRQHRMYKLIRPFQDSQEVLIPRSNGSQTHGLAQTEYVFKRNGQWFVYAYWFVNSDLFYKIVPLDTYSNKTPRVLFPLLQ